MMSEQNFEIKLPVFEGPFDLLLFFIERDELDIHNIPIAKITGDFLDYMHGMGQMNMEIASEFILVASTLMRIKAKMLLPRYKKDDDGNALDLSHDLVQQLLEYKRFKEAAEEFRAREEERLHKIERGNIQSELARIALDADQNNYQSELETLTLFKLLTTFEKVMDRFKHSAENNTHTVVQFPFTIDKEKDFLKTLVMSKPRCSFIEIFEACQSKMHAVFTFLALLELIQQGELSLITGDGFNNFWIGTGENQTLDAN